MKTLVVFLGLFLAQPVLCQDSIKTLDKVFAKDNNSFTHIIDFRLSFGNLDLGYNFIYNLNSKVGFGIRTGLWYYKSDPNQIPETFLREGFKYSFDLQAMCQIWKSVYFEFGGGYFNTISWPTSTNTTVGQQGTKIFGDMYHVWPAMRVYLYKHLFFKGGMNFIYDDIPNNWYTSYTVSIGYKI